MKFKSLKMGTLTMMMSLGVITSMMLAVSAWVFAKDGGEARSGKKTQLDFEGASIEGEIRNPGEFYFQRKSEEKMSSLVKRRTHFHRQLLRDVVQSK